MFVRRKKNRSGTTSVVVVDKHGGKFLPSAKFLFIFIGNGFASISPFPSAR